MTKRISVRNFTAVADFVAFVNGNVKASGTLSCATVGPDVTAVAFGGFADVEVGDAIFVSGIADALTVTGKADDDNLTLSDDVPETESLAWVVYDGTGIGWTNVLDTDASNPDRFLVIYTPVNFGS